MGEEFGAAGADEDGLEEVEGDVWDFEEFAGVGEREADVCYAVPGEVVVAE